MILRSTMKSALLFLCLSTIATAADDPMPPVGAPRKPGIANQVLNLGQNVLGRKPGSLSWSIAPRESRGIVIVQNMQDFSDKLDQIAVVMGLAKPGVLEYAIKLSKINKGLKRDGSLMWFFGKPDAGGTPLVYLIPSSDHDRLIRPLSPRKTKGVTQVEVEGKTMEALPIPGYSLFAEPYSNAWLQSCSQGGTGTIVPQLGELNTYLARQDIGFAITNAAVSEGLSVRLPFSKGDYVVPTALTQSANLYFDSLGIIAMGGGTELIPAEGVRLSIASALAPQSRLSNWSSTMTCQRDELLETLPEIPTALLLASSSCDVWNQAIEEFLLSDQFNSDDRLKQLLAKIDLESFQGFSLQLHAAEDPDLDPEQALKPFHLQLKVDDSKVAFEGVRTWLRLFQQLFAAELPELTLLDERLADRDVFTLVYRKPEADDLRLTLSLTILDNDTLVVQGGGLNRLRGILDLISQRKRLRNDTSFNSTVQMIDKDAQQMFLLDVFRTYELVYQNLLLFKLIKVGDANPVLPLVQPFENAPPLGIGNTFQPELIETQVASPNQLLKPLSSLKSLFFLFKL